MTFYTPPALVREATDKGVAAAKVAAVAGETLHLTATEVALAISGYKPLEEHHLRAMAAHPYEPGTIAAEMMGGAAGQEWAEGVIIAEHDGRIRAFVAAAADEAVVEADHLAAERKALALLSKRLNQVDQRFRSKVEGVLAQAMRRAESHARTKAGVRAKRTTRAKLAAVEGDFAAGRFTPEVLLALSTTDEELLAGLFDDASAEVGDLFQERQQARRTAIMQAFAALGVHVDDLAARWDVIENQREATLTAFVGLAMMTEARDRLQSGKSGDAIYQGQLGEIPFDTSVPGSIVSGVIKIADGASVSANGTVDSKSALEHPNPLEDFTDPLVTDLLGDLTSDDAGQEFTWEVGDPSRPFEPHQDLAGMTFTVETYLDVCGKDPGDFPYDTVAYQPLDHAGCSCWISTAWVVGGGSTLTE